MGEAGGHPARPTTSHPVPRVLLSKADQSVDGDVGALASQGPRGAPSPAAYRVVHVVGAGPAGAVTWGPGIRPLPCGARVRWPARRLSPLGFLPSESVREMGAP